MSCYYAASSLLHKRGERWLEKMLSALRVYPEMDVDSAQKMRLMNERTRKVMEKSVEKVGDGR